MERLQPGASVAVPVTALALAAGAAVSFGVGDAVGFLSDAAEDMFVLTWLLGWVLVAWAAILGGGYAVSLGVRRRSRRPVSRSDVALVAASFALTGAVLVTHPLWGLGSGGG
jgi:hypothetical protein